jgi:hypothetical protein
MTPPSVSSSTSDSAKATRWTKYVTMTVASLAVLLEGGIYDHTIVVPDSHTEVQAIDA